MTDKIRVNHYGLFNLRDEPWWLLQENGQCLNSVGLPSEDCPFVVDTKLLCPHNFPPFSKVNFSDVDVSAYNRTYIKSELLKLLSPVPYRTDVKIVYINTKSIEDVRLIQQMFSLCGMDRYPNGGMSSIDRLKFNRPIELSNIGRQLLYGLRSSNNGPKLDTYIHNTYFNCQGRLFICGNDILMYNVKDYVWTVEVDKYIKKFYKSYNYTYELRNIGQKILRDFMREF